MRYRKGSKLERQQTVLMAAAVFAVVGGLVLTAPASINFQLALAQEQQGQQPPPPSSSNLNETAASSSPSPINQTNNATSSASSAVDNETGVGELLSSPTETNATVLQGKIGSIQAAHQGNFAWSTAGDWVMQLDGPLVGRAEPKIQSFNATIFMVRLDGNILHDHRISNFNQTSVSQVGDDMTIFNGTMTVTLREGPVENVSGYIQLLGDSVAIWVDPRAVQEHFGTTPIQGMVLPQGEEQVLELG